MRVLFTTPILEYPSAGGPQLRIENTIKALSRVCDLYVIYFAAYPSQSVSAAEEYFKQYSIKIITIYKYPKNRLLRLLLRVLRRLLPPGQKSQSNHIKKTVFLDDIDVVWFGFGNISFSLIKEVNHLLPDVKTVCDTDSVWSRFILRELPFADPSRQAKIRLAGAQKSAEEKAWVNLCDVTTAVSDVDASYYRSLALEPERVHLFANVIDINSYQQIPDRPPNYHTPCIFLAGSYGPNSAMNQAANWVLDDVLPLVRKSYPDLHFYIVGRGSDQQLGHRASANVTVTGILDSVLPYLRYASVALVPLKFESGTRFKILEAAACHVPLVSTTLGAEGLPLVHGEHILVADQAADFAHAIIRILEDQDFAQFLAANCYDLVSRYYSVEVLELQASHILEYLSGS